MIETIAPTDVDLNGAALAVRYQADPTEPERLLVSLLAHRTEGEPSRIRKYELRCILNRQPMTRAELVDRVETEAKRRGIDRVAWIDEGS